MAGDPIQRLLADPPALPVRDGLTDLVAALRTTGTAVVQAPPGTGKTTLVPPSVAALVAGPVVVTQPRRVAARAAARRLAQLLGEPVGRTVGYAVRGDRHAGPDTRIEFVTTGVLLRRLQREADLPGAAAVVLDEVHERQLDSDLTLAMLVEVRAHLRPDLVVVAMSATVEAERTASLLGGTAPAPVVAVPGSLHPVVEVWCPPAPGVRRADDRGLTPRFLDHVAGCVRRALAEQDGDVLVFSQLALFTGAGAKNVGTDKPITVSDIRLSGADAGNYALASTTAHITIPCASVIGANFIATQTAQHLVDRQAGDFAAEIPQRHVDGADGPDRRCPAAVP